MFAGRMLELSAIEIGGRRVRGGDADVGCLCEPECGSGIEAAASLGGGDFAATCGTLLGNYVLQVMASGFVGRIDQRALGVRVNDADKQYDGAPFFGGNGVTYNGFAAGETELVLGGTLVYAVSAQGAVEVGTYETLASGLGRDELRDHLPAWCAYDTQRGKYGCCG